MTRWRYRSSCVLRGLWPEVWTVNLPVWQESQLRRRTPPVHAIALVHDVEAVAGGAHGCARATSVTAQRNGLPVFMIEVFGQPVGHFRRHHREVLAPLSCAPPGATLQTFAIKLLSVTSLARAPTERLTLLGHDLRQVPAFHRNQQQHPIPAWNRVRRQPQCRSRNNPGPGRTG